MSLHDILYYSSFCHRRHAEVSPEGIRQPVDILHRQRVIQVVYLSVIFQYFNGRIT